MARTARLAGLFGVVPLVPMTVWVWCLVIVVGVDGAVGMAVHAAAVVDVFGPSPRS